MSEKRASRRPRPAATAALVAALTVAVTVAGAVTPAGAAPRVPRGVPEAPGTTEEVASYIVVLNGGAPSPQALASEHGVGPDVNHVYRHALRGYSADLTPAEVRRLRADRRVAFVEPDQTLQVAVQTVPTGIRRVFADQNPVMDIDGQDDVRIDVDVAVIDTGTNNHPDLNVVARADCSFGFGFCMEGTGSDGNGHGTHVAGSIGAVDNGDGVVGVAPGARIHSVRVCNSRGSCSLSAIIAGVDYVTARAGTIEVANMSLGGEGSSTALSQAITRSVDAGVVHVVAAGNSRADASRFFPASHPDVVAVSALADSDGQPGGRGPAPSCRTQSRDDVLADFSNYGRVVDLAAPGVCILSTWRDGGYRTISGTSMASPHAAGAAAVLARGGNDPTSRADVVAIRQELLAAGNFDWTDDSGDGVKEPLLDAGDID